MMVHGLVAAACVLSVFLWGFATWWLLLAISSTAATACKSGVPFNLGYWAAIFPVGVYAGATCLLGKTMAGYSRSFDVLGAIAVCCHVLLWLVVVAFTAKGAWTGELFHAPCLAGAPKGAARTPATAAAAAEVESRLQRAA
jgi:tellurite resistance protein TehA-like permease